VNDRQEDGMRNAGKDFNLERNIETTDYTDYTDFEDVRENDQPTSKVSEIPANSFSEISGQNGRVSRFHFLAPFAFLRGQFSQPQKNAENTKLRFLRQPPFVSSRLRVKKSKGIPLANHE
jgi:hypothetical protein